MFLEQENVPKGTLERSLETLHVGVRFFYRNIGTAIMANHPIYIKLNKEVLTVRILRLVTTLSHAVAVW